MTLTTEVTAPDFWIRNWNCCPSSTNFAVSNKVTDTCAAVRVVSILTTHTRNSKSIRAITPHSQSEIWTRYVCWKQMPLVATKSNNAKLYVSRTELRTDRLTNRLDRGLLYMFTDDLFKPGAQKIYNWGTVTVLTNALAVVNKKKQKTRCKTWFLPPPPPPAGGKTLSAIFSKKVTRSMSVILVRFN